MFHHEHSAMVGVACVHSSMIFVVGVLPVHSVIIFVVRIVRVIRELSAYGGRFAHLLSALFFVVVEFSVISAFGCILTTRAGVETPPSCEGSSLASVLRPKLGNCCRRSDLARLVLGRIGLSLVRVLFVHSSACRACGLPTHCSLYARGFLRPIALIGARRRREISPC